MISIENMYSQLTGPGSSGLKSKLLWCMYAIDKLGAGCYNKVVTSSSPGSQGLPYKCEITVLDVAACFASG